MHAVDGADGPGTWRDLTVAGSLLRTAVNRRLQAQAGLSLAEELVLCELAVAPAGRLQMVAIARQLGIRKSGVTRTVDRLEARGWIARRRDVDDRRAVHAVLTRPGAAAFERARPVFKDAVDGHLRGPLTDTELRQLRRLLGKLLRALPAGG